MFKSLVCALFLGAAVLPALPEGALPPQGVSDSDSRAVRAVVEAQLKALAAGDTARAFSHAAPAIQQQFQDATTFDQMVRRSYPMLIRPASVSFYRPLAGENVVVQSVVLRDREGRAWRADYQLQRQPDRRWRISGCQVVPGDAGSTT